jgi:hypothetical protein
MNGVIAGVTWGAVDTDGTWRVVHEHPSVKRPQPGLSNYLWHLEATLPGKPHKAERDVRASAFTAVGSPGECMRGHFENLMTALMLPPHMRGTTAARVRTLQTTPRLVEFRKSSGGLTGSRMRERHRDETRRTAEDSRQTSTSYASLREEACGLAGRCRVHTPPPAAVTQLDSLTLSWWDRRWGWIARCSSSRRSSSCCSTSRRAVSPSLSCLERLGTSLRPW